MKVHANTVYKMCARGELPHVRFGYKILIPSQSLEDWLVRRAGEMP